MLAKMMAKFNYRAVYESLAEKCREMGDQQRLAECLTSLGIKEIFNCTCTTGLCDKAIERARRCLDEAHDIQTDRQVNKGNSRAQCLAKLGRCLVRSRYTERGKAMIEDAIRIRNAPIETRDDHDKEGGENVCHVMQGATYNDMAEFEAAEEYAKQALRIRRELLADHSDTTKSLFDLGVALKANKKFKEAKDLLE
ncbi:hypothetical protein P5673_014002 [Acropora cervicornis]|uniref:Tetratricopeptide repeat protein n=1 Tax=Acropora cervicornis TaxID=6130 RepID=A0AAD9QL82_ACRCE|nr:hypothetical protein P5673_014002 [Acropora cervicornis]